MRTRWGTVGVHAFDVAPWRQSDGPRLCHARSATVSGSSSRTRAYDLSASGGSDVHAESSLGLPHTRPAPTPPTSSAFLLTGTC